MGELHIPFRDARIAETVQLSARSNARRYHKTFNWKNQRSTVVNASYDTTDGVRDTWINPAAIVIVHRS